MSDFQRGFSHLNMTYFEIQRIFEYADIDMSGKVTLDEWSHFYDTYIYEFEKGDEDQDGTFGFDETKNFLNEF